MRAVQLADVECAARALMMVGKPARSRLMAEMLRQADLADRYRKRLRRMHAEFGTGTLMSAASRFALAPRPARLDPDALHAFAIVIKALEDHSA